MVDLAEIIVKGGRGGDGCLSFLHTRSRKKRIPDGGSGGRGGDVFLIADSNLSTLIDFHTQAVFKAGDGRRGGSNGKTGRQGDDLVLKVPLGTVVRGLPSREVLVDLNQPGQKYLVASGGLGGKGNQHFSPTHKLQGFLGESGHLELEVQLIADLGLVGLPNAGKTTLLNALTSAHGEVAPYPFTTLSPNLGVMPSGVVLADIPGLVEGASEGRGLGDQFLRHAKRTRGLIHVLAFPLEEEVSVPQEVWNNYLLVRKELAEYDHSLEVKPQMVVLNKVDLAPNKEVLERALGFLREKGLKVVPVSALSGEGFRDLQRELEAFFNAAPPRIEPVKTSPVFGIEDLNVSSLVFDARKSEESPSR